MGDFYQEERLGKYMASGESSDGRTIYRQQGGENFLFYLASPGVWMVGPEPGRDLGGVLNRQGGDCPELLTNDWEYWNDLMDSWSSDSSMTATCGPAPTSPPGEPCTWGSQCDGCSIWAEADGVRYCCAVGCDYGEVEVSTENGEVTCTCHH